MFCIIILVEGVLLPPASNYILALHTVILFLFPIFVFVGICIGMHRTLDSWLRLELLTVFLFDDEYYMYGYE